MKWLSHAAVVALGLFGNTATAVTLDLADNDSIREASATIAYGLMRFYTGNNTGDVPGNLPDPYFWWECGAMFGHMVDYWALTGDDSYNNVTLQALVHQTGENRDYNPRNQSQSMGNDDQGFWAMAAMSAAENMFPDPPEDQPQYVPTVQSVFNEYARRWEVEDCNGGMRWQVFSTSDGYEYKNSISNGCFFNIAARLGRYTGNDTYLEWANRIWDWEVERNLITDQLEIRDGVQIGNQSQCNEIDETQWTYNAGIFLYGAAVMYNITESDEWKSRVDGILANTQERFFQEGIIYEQRCEPFDGACNLDQRSFKGYLTRWLSGTSKLASHTRDTIRNILQPNAEAAAAICTGTSAAEFRGHPGTACGFRWSPEGVNDGSFGVGEQMSALSVIMHNLEDQRPPPVTLDTGGTSEDDPTGGVEDRTVTYGPITTGDRVGAGILTTLLCAGIIGYTVFMVIY